MTTFCTLDDDLAELCGVSDFSGVEDAPEEADDDDDDDDARAAPPLEVARVALAELRAARFASEFAAPRVPVVVEGCARAAWFPAHLTLDRLVARHGEKPIPLEPGSARARHDVPLRAFAAALRRPAADDAAGLGALYLRNAHCAAWLGDDAAALAPPPIFGPNLLADAAATPGVPRAWRAWAELFVCGPRCAGYPFTHRDVAATSAYSMQVEGAKTFVLFAPDAAHAAALYAEPAGAGASGRRSAVPDVATALGLRGRGGEARAALLARFPALRRARPVVARLGPGDVLFCPPEWWHTTFPTPPAAGGAAGAPCVTVGGNFVEAHGHEAFLDAYADHAALASLQSAGAAAMR